MLRSETAMDMLKEKCGRFKILMDSVIRNDKDLEYYIFQGLFYAFNPTVNIYAELRDVMKQEGIRKITQKEAKDILEMIKDKSKMEAIEIVEKTFNVKFRT